MPEPVQAQEGVLWEPQDFWAWTKTVEGRGGVKEHEISQICYDIKTGTLDFYRCNFSQPYYWMEIDSEDFLPTLIHVSTKYEIEKHITELLRFCKVYFVDKEPMPDVKRLIIYKANFFVDARGKEHLVKNLARSEKARLVYK